MIQWPAELPCALRGKGRAPQPNVIAFGTEVGPGKLRRRSTARVKRMPISFLLTRTQVAAFERFFEDDLEDGALPFAMPDPITGDAASWRFDPEGPYSLDERPSGKWSLSANLMQVP